MVQLRNYACMAAGWRVLSRCECYGRTILHCLLLLLLEAVPYSPQHHHNHGHRPRSAAGAAARKHANARGAAKYHRRRGLRGRMTALPVRNSDSTSAGSLVPLSLVRGA